ncbi:cation diffusion facilitator family transporter [Brucella endophytica]|nr:cation transporter [Brucella endophytica]
MMEKSTFFDFGDERGVLRISIAVTILVAAVGIAFGLLSGSFSIVFDGIYSLVDAGMSFLALIVTRLITSYATSQRLSPRLRKRFSMGFWHFEPILVGLNGVILISVAVYAFFNAASRLLDGGHELEFGWALLYAAVAVAVCFLMAAAETRANRKIGSDFLRIDIKSWIMDGGITAALLVAFCLGYAVQGTQWQWLSPYIDPGALMLVCLVIIPLPISTVRQAFSEMLLITPASLLLHVETVAQRFTEKYRFTSYRAYAAKVGRSTQIELYFIVPPGSPARAIEEWDKLRDEIGDALGEASPDRWLTIVFTADPEWAE